MSLHQSRTVHKVTVSEFKKLNNVIVEDLNPPKFFMHETLTDNDYTIKLTSKIDQVNYEYSVRLEREPFRIIKPAQSFFEGGPMTDEVILPAERMDRNAVVQRETKIFIGLVMQKYVEFVQRVLRNLENCPVEEAV